MTNNHKSKIKVEEQSMIENEELVKEESIDEGSNPMRQIDFLNLSVCNEKNADIYNKAIDFALNDNDVKNFAISGQYGAGKSSILRSYLENNNVDKKIFKYLSLTNFDFDESQDTGSKPKDNEAGEKENLRSGKSSNKIESIIEWKLISKLVYQADMSKIYLTEFKRKENSSEETTNKITKRIVLFILFLYYYFFYNVLKFNVSILDNPIAKGIFSLFVNDIVLVFSVGYICYSLFILIQKIVKFQFFKKIIKRLNINGYEIEFISDDTKSYFDKYLDEIIYIFKNIDADVIVFEDIDRFQEYQIFTRLREINSIINQGRKENPLKFLYLISDDIFESKDRTKFFDFIIPIIPVADSTNSYGYVVQLLTNIGIDDGAFDYAFLRGISLYIDDMRLLKNICNEYKIYLNRLDCSSLSKENLFTMICYKNIYPVDFEKLQHRSGILYEYINYIHDTFDNLNNINSSDKFSLLLSDEYLEITTPEDSTPQKNTLMDNFRNDINIKQKSKINIPANFDFGFLNFSISNGYLGDNYEHYISIFPKDALVDEDRRFVNVLNEGGRLKPDYKIFNVELVSTYLGKKQLCREQILNYDMFKYFLSAGGWKSIIFIEYIKSKLEYDFIVGYIEYLQNDLRDIGLMFEIFSIQWRDFIIDFINDSDDEDKEKIISVLIQWLRLRDITNFIANDADSSIANFISKNAVILRFPHKEVVEAAKTLEILKIRFEKVDCKKSNKDLISIIYKKELYEINEHNLREFLASKYKIVESKKIDNRLLSTVWSNKEQQLYKYCTSNIVKFVDVLLDCQEIFDDNQNSVIELLNNVDISVTKKVEIIKKFNGVIKSLDEVKIKNVIWDELIENEKIYYNEENIVAYFKFTSMEVTVKLINFINSNINYKLDFSKLGSKQLEKIRKDVGQMEIDEIMENEMLQIMPEVRELKELMELKKKFMLKSFVENDLIDIKYKEIVATCGFTISSFPNTTSKEKIKIDIDNNIINMTESNLASIRNYYSIYKFDFIKNKFLDYIEIMTATLADKDEILNILDWKCEKSITNENKCKLISFIGAIPLKNKTYDEKIVSYILKNNYDSTDNSWIFERYKQFTSKIQNALIEIANTILPNIVNETYKSDKWLKKSLILNEKSIATPTQKMDLFCLLIKECRKKELTTLCKYLPIAESEKYLQLLGNNDHIEFERTSQNMKILNELMIHKYIIDIVDLQTSLRADKNLFSKND